jgi:hypothetical protein
VRSGNPSRPWATHGPRGQTGRRAGPRRSIWFFSLIQPAVGKSGFCLTGSPRQPPPGLRRNGGVADAFPRDQRDLPRSGGRAGRGRADRRRGRGGAVQPPQARQAPGAVLGLGAARAGGRLVPPAGRVTPAGPRRGGVLLRPRPGPARAGGPGRALGGAAHPLRAPRPALPRHRAPRPRPRPGAVRAAPRRARRIGLPRRAVPGVGRAGLRRTRRGRVPPGGPPPRR